MNKFVSPNELVAQTSAKFGGVVVDFGCGSGYYTAASSKVVGPIGKVYAVDINDASLSFTQSIARESGVNNIVTVKGDLQFPCFGLPELTADLVIASSILHQVNNRKGVFANAYRVLKPGAEMLVVEWKKEPSPFGPNLQIRVTPAQVEEELVQTGFQKIKDLTVDGYHYAMLFRKL